MLKKINQYLIIVGSVVMMISYFPQIIQIVSTKSSAGISLSFIAMVTFAIMTFTINGFVIYRETDDPTTLIAQLANLVPALILCFLILLYK